MKYKLLTGHTLTKADNVIPFIILKYALIYLMGNWKMMGLEDGLPAIKMPRKNQGILKYIM
jgi:hypothetical protein